MAFALLLSVPPPPPFLLQPALKRVAAFGSAARINPTQPVTGLLTWTAPVGETPLSYTVVWWLNQGATPPNQPGGATTFTTVTNVTETEYLVEAGDPGDTLYAQVFAVYTSGYSVPTAVVSTAI